MPASLAGEDQQAVWSDIAKAMHAALVELEADAPRRNPDQVEESPAVAKLAARNEEKRRARRAGAAAAQAEGTGEPPTGATV